MKIQQIIPLTYILVALIFMLILNFALPVLRLIPWLWGFFGLISLIGGVAVNLIADRAFLKAGTTAKPFQGSMAFITDRVFCIRRHLMYLGFVLILIGVAILLGSLTPWVIVLIFSALMEIVFVQVEQHMLAEKFGPA
jgi:protein-S-isoprenylcysteine O-methyltransferase Ste14